MSWEGYMPLTVIRRRGVPAKRMLNFHGYMIGAQVMQVMTPLFPCGAVLIALRIRFAAGSPFWCMQIRWCLRRCDCVRRCIRFFFSGNTYTSPAAAKHLLPSADFLSFILSSCCCFFCPFNYISDLGDEDACLHALPSMSTNAFRLNGHVIYAMRLSCSLDYGGSLQGIFCSRHGGPIHDILRYFNLTLVHLLQAFYSICKSLQRASQRYPEVNKARILTGWPQPSIQSFYNRDFHHYALDQYWNVEVGGIFRW